MADLQLALVLVIVIACVMVATTPASQGSSRRVLMRRERGERPGTRRDRRPLGRQGRNAWNRVDLARGVTASDLDSMEAIWPPQVAKRSAERGS